MPIQSYFPEDATIVETIGVLLKRLFVLAAAIGVVWWLVYVVRAPHQKLSAQEELTLSKALIAAAGKLYEKLIGTNNVGGELEDALEGLVLQASAEAESPESRRKLLAILQSDPRTSAVLRMEPRQGNNLVIYLRKTDFEAVPYPDRKEFVEGVGKAWCDNTGEDSHWFLPSVYIGDIQTGEQFAEYDCVHWYDLLPH